MLTKDIAQRLNNMQHSKFENIVKTDDRDFFQKLFGSEQSQGPFAVEDNKLKFNGEIEKSLAPQKEIQAFFNEFSVYIDFISNTRTGHSGGYYFDSRSNVFEPHLILLLAYAVKICRSPDNPAVVTPAEVSFLSIVIYMQRLHSSEIDFAEKLSKDDKVSQRKMLEKFLQRDTVRINELSEPLLNLANSFTSMVDCFKPAKETAISTARSEDKMHHQYSEALPATMIVVGLGLSICAGTSLAMLVPGVLCALVGFAWLMLKGTADQAPAYEGCSSFGQTN